MKIAIFLILYLFIVGCLQQQAAPVCNKPYILVGTSCCLDKNDNKICDRDERIEQGEEQGKELPKEDSNIEIPDSIPLTECKKYEWPSDCNYITNAEGKKLCEQCKEWCDENKGECKVSSLPFGEDSGIRREPQHNEELLAGPKGCESFECQYTCLEDKQACLTFCTENKEICDALNLNLEEKTLDALSNKWVQVNHPLAGHVTDMGFDKNGYLYAGTGSNGIYLSKDLETWSEVNTMDMHVNSVAPASEGIVYFGAGSIYKMNVNPQSPQSTEVTDLFEGQIGSGNWAGGIAVTDKGIFGSSRNGFYKIVNDKPEKIPALDGYAALAISSNNDYVFAAARKIRGGFGGPVEKLETEGKGSMVFYSQDGINWASTKIEGDATDIVALENVVFVATSKGVFKSNDNGKTFSSVGLDKFVTDLEATKSGKVYAATRNGVYKFENELWSETGFPKIGLLGDAREVIASPSNENIIIIGTAYGILKSEDGGKIFKEINNGFYDKNSVDVHVDEKNKDIVWSGTGCDGGIFRSIDGGLSWNIIGGEHIPGTTGMDTHYFMKTAIDPRDSKHVLVTTSDGLFITENGGKEWKLVKDENEYFAPEFPDFQKTGTRLGYHFHGITIDMKNPDIIFVGTGGSTILGDISSPELRVLKSTDNGKTWRDMSKGLPDDPKTSFHSITIDPNNSNIIYAPTHGEQIGLYPKFEPTAYGIYKSTDGGESWVAINNGLDEHELEITEIAIDHKNSNALYAAGHGVFKSSDAGKSWQQKLELEETHENGGGHAEGINTIIIHPKNNKIIYAAGMGGVYKSTDAGETWEKFNEGLGENDAALKINTIATDSEGTVMYAGTSREGVFKRKI